MRRVLDDARNSLLRVDSEPASTQKNRFRFGLSSNGLTRAGSPLGKASVESPRLCRFAIGANGWRPRRSALCGKRRRAQVMG